MGERMSIAVILVYLASYLTLCVSALREGRPPGDRRPTWLLAVSAACDVVGGVGVFLYALDVRLEGFWLPLWRAVALLLAVVENLVDQQATADLAFHAAFSLRPGS